MDMSGFVNVFRRFLEMSDFRRLRFQRTTGFFSEFLYFDFAIYSCQFDIWNIFNKMTHRKQLFSARWKLDPIKNSYASGNVGDETFTCKKCGKVLACETIYGHIKNHEEEKDLEPGQLSLEELNQSAKLEKQSLELTIVNFLCKNNLSFALCDDLVEMLEELKVKELYRYIGLRSLNRKIASKIATTALGPFTKASIEKVMDS